MPTRVLRQYRPDLPDYDSPGRTQIAGSRASWFTRQVTKAHRPWQCRHVRRSHGRIGRPWRFINRVTVYLSLMDDRYPATDEHQSVHLDYAYPIA
jgi:hypothetical protein